MSDITGGILFQLRLYRRVPGSLLLFAVIPFFSAIFLSAARYQGPAYLTPRPVLAPAIMGMWLVSVVLAETVVSLERAYGTLEIIVSSPANFAGVVAGRVLTMTLLGLVTVAEALIVARCFGAAVAVHHPVAFTAGLVATAIATAGTATALTGLFLAFRPSQRYVNTLGYPFYILAGVLVPVTFLPSWIRPVADVLYLHWSADLLYSAMARPPVPGAAGSVAVILLIGCTTYGVGALLIAKVIDRLRASGELGLT
jgi:ABC-2 type transport system permease protein